MKEIRTLNATEVECRVQSVTEKGCILLVYKDARVDMKILDEVFGIDGWQRTHQVINENLFCTIEIWSEKSNSWIKKQDVGVESKTEQQKGEASDAFKRAAFNIGIGRELYTAPFTWVNLDPSEITDYQGKKQLRKGIKFTVSEIGYNDEREISNLKIIDNKNAVRFEMNKKIEPKTDTVPKVITIEEYKAKLKKCTTLETLKACFKLMPGTIQKALADYTTELKNDLLTLQKINENV